MKNQSPHDGVEVLGEAAVQDLTTEVQSYLDALDDDQLEEDTIMLRREIDALSTRFSLNVAEVERRGIPQRTHRLSATGWLARFCSLTRNEASGTVRAARALKHMPSIRAKALTGEVPYRSVRFLAQARDRHPEEFAGQEPLFADAAARLSPGEMWRVINDWEQQVDYQQSLENVRALDKLRSLSLSPIGNGLHDMRGTLTTEAAHVVGTAIQALTNPANLDAAHNRTPAQMRHDALVDVCHHFLDHSDEIATSGGDKPHITVTVPYETLSGPHRKLGELDGSPVDPEIIRKWACDAGIVRIVTDGDSQPLDVGRRVRTATPAIRRAVELRDGGCAWPGCGAPVSWCDVHHIVHWADGGETSLDNVELLCRRHHNDTHDGRPRPDD
ncbi:MAG: DUF222 domain-containing protein [Actinomycetota bacterium]